MCLYSITSITEEWLTISIVKNVKRITVKVKLTDMRDIQTLNLFEFGAKNVQYFGCIKLEKFHFLEQYKQIVSGVSNVPCE